MGNESILCRRGKVVNVSKSVGKCPIFQMMKEQGCGSVYDVKKINFENLEEIIQSANRDRANNVAIVKKIYSEETRLNDWRELLKEG